MDINHEFERFPCQIDGVGLKVGGIYQTFWWERLLQSAVAKHIVARHKSVANLGIGLALSLDAFVKSNVRLIAGIDIRADLCARARGIWPDDNRLIIYKEDWKDLIKRGELDRFDAIYFDAFPVTASFCYTWAEFKLEFDRLSDLLQERAYHGSAYFLSFLEAKRHTPIRYREVLRIPLPRTIQGHSVTDAILFELNERHSNGANK